MNALAMQNWEHVQVFFDMFHIFLLFACILVCPFEYEQPTERLAWRGLLAYQAMVFRWPVSFFLAMSFAWCLVSTSSSYLRQSILLSPFEMPETRALFNNTLKNTAGKVRVEKTWPVIRVPESIDQVSTFFIDWRAAYLLSKDLCCFRLCEPKGRIR